MGRVSIQQAVLRSALEEAYSLVSDAIAKLDAVRASSDIAAHLDFALHRTTAEMEPQRA